MLLVLPKKTWAGWGRESIVGLITTIWRRCKNKRQVAAPISMSHVLTFRVAEMKVQEGKADVWTCSATSNVWNLMPEAGVAVLDIKSQTETAEECQVVMSDDSMRLLKDLEHVADWWPRNDAFGKYDTLFLPRQGQGRKKQPQKATEQEPDHAESQEELTDMNAVAPAENKTAANKKKKHTLKVRRTRLKQVAKMVEMLPGNLRKNKQGRDLIMKEMEKLKGMDDSIFKNNPLFAADSCKCRIKAPVCSDVLWQDVVKFVFPYFKVRFLG